MYSSLGDPDVTEDYDEYDNTSNKHGYEEGIILSNVGWSLCVSVTLISLSFGFVGNGYIIRLLGFQIKRNSFTTFILNLAIADFGYLASLYVFIIAKIADLLEGNIIFVFCDYFIQVMYISANFLLTAISIDRCRAVLFPTWHRCFQPKPLSSTVCVLLWIFSFLLSGIMMIMHVFGYNSHLNYHFLVTAIVCFPLISLSTLVLSIKVCLKSNQRNQGQLLLMILITLLCFLIFASPLNVLAVIVNFSTSDNQLRGWFFCSIAFSCLNSNIKPVIYFLVGKKKGTGSKQSIKLILQSIFKEAEETLGR